MTRTDRAEVVPDTSGVLEPVVEQILAQTVYAPVRQGDIVAETVARLGRAIGMGLLRPGDKLPPEARLADDLGISVASVRSALAMLRSAGVLVTQRGRGGGTVVRSSRPAQPETGDMLPDEATLLDLADYRAVIEGGTAALAARRATPKQLDHLRSLVREMSEICTFSDWSEQDTLFHLVIAHTSGSERLLAEVGRIRAEVFRLSQLVPVPPEATDLAGREHEALVAAIAARDAERARGVMVSHVESTRALWIGLGRVPGAAETAAVERHHAGGA